MQVLQALSIFSFLQLILVCCKYIRQLTVYSIPLLALAALAALAAPSAHLHHVCQIRVKRVLKLAAFQVRTPQPGFFPVHLDTVDTGFPDLWELAGETT